jgi:hypothetical protein
MSTQVLGYFSGSNHSTQSTANAGRPVPPSKPPRQAEVEARGQVAIDKLREFAAEKQALQQQNASLDNEIKVIRQERAELQAQKSAALARQQESQDKRVQYLGNLKNMVRIINEQICIVNGLGSTNPNKGNLLNDLNQLNQRGAAIEPVILNGKFAEFIPQLKSLQTDLKEIREKVTIAKA